MTRSIRQQPLCMNLRLSKPIQFLADLMNEDKSAPSFDLQRDSSNVSQLFMTGQVAMVFGNHALIPNFMEAEDLEWDIVGMPRAEGKDPVNVAAGAGYVISENTEHLEEAFLLWSFLLGPEGQEILRNRAYSYQDRRKLKIHLYF